LKIYLSIIGESKKLREDGDFLSHGINCYSSYDLGNWKFEGEVFSNTRITGISKNGPYRIERPKVIFNEVLHFLDIGFYEQILDRFINNASSFDLKLPI